MRDTKSYNIAFMLPVLILFACSAWAADRYPDVAALKAARRAGVDYRETLQDRGAPVTVLAIHGGTIEPGTSALARLLAGEDWNLYLFEALLPPAAATALHVASHHFDDPAAVALAERSAVAISLHGARGAGKNTCVGGREAGLPAALAGALREAGFDVEQPCRRLPSVKPANIVNRARAGVQLELTLALRRALEADSELAGRYVRAVRSAIRP